MRASGTIYRSSQESSGELRISLTEKERGRFRLFRVMGTNASSLALAFMLFFYGPTFEQDLSYQAGLAKVEASEVGEVEIVKNQTNEFVISIPAIGASARVVPDVNPFDETIYRSALKEGIAHAANTSKPGEGGRVYLFAHSTNSPVNFSEYNAIFYQLRLLTEGDRIFVNYNGDSHLYIVTEKVVVNANDTHWLIETSSEEQLVLQTCDPPGTTLRRLLVVAKLSS